MVLKHLVANLSCELLSGDYNVEISDITYDSRKVKPGSLFLCIDGVVTDGHRYIANAIASGAVAIMVQKDVDPVPGVTFLKTENTRYAMANLADTFFAHPSKKMQMIGVTGTKGKTTTTFMLKHIYKAAGIETGLVGTIQNMIGEHAQYAERTTPEAYDLHLLFAKMLDANINTCIMEVSSQGLYLDRVACIQYDIGVFTNLSPDHIGPGEHASMEEYAFQKAKLFQRCKKGLINIDSPYANTMMKDATCEIYTFGIEQEADFCAKNIVTHPDGVSFTLQCPYGTTEIKTCVPGLFSVYNALAAIGAALLSGNVTLEAAKVGIADVKVPGRAESVPTNGDYSIIIDYAHNPDSFINILTTVKGYAQGRVVFLFGCGGDKQRPRELMGETAGRYADFSIITSDNPRTEDPLSIMLDLEKGIKKTDGKYILIVDRKEAIKYAILNAQPKDVIILAGKGHETYQIFKDKTIHFDEREVVAEILEELK